MTLFIFFFIFEQYKSFLLFFSSFYRPATERRTPGWMRREDCAVPAIAHLHQQPCQCNAGGHGENTQEVLGHVSWRPQYACRVYPVLYNHKIRIVYYYYENTFIIIKKCNVI